MSYDTRCLDLALWLIHEEDWAQASDVHALAQEIQDVVELWIAGHRPAAVDDAR